MPIRKWPSTSQSIPRPRSRVCNALETLLIEESIAADFLPQFAAALRAKDVELRGCEKSRVIFPNLIPAADAPSKFTDLQRDEINIRAWNISFP